MANIDIVRPRRITQEQSESRLAGTTPLRELVARTIFKAVDLVRQTGPSLNGGATHVESSNTGALAFPDTNISRIDPFVGEKGQIQVHYLNNSTRPRQGEKPGVVVKYLTPYK